MIGKMLSTRLFNSLRRIATSSAVRSEGMALTFASPGNVYYKQVTVRQVDVPSLSGSFGILPEHVPTLACLKPGVVAIHESDGTVKRFFVSSGTVTVNADSSVQVLAEEAVTLDMLDHASVREGLTKAQQELGAATTEVAKAEAQIAVECWESMNRAVDEKHV